MSIQYWFLTLIIFMTGIAITHASHFVGGSISYKVVGTNGSKVIVRITQSYTYVYPTIYCNNTYIANQWNLILTPYGDATAVLNCTADCTTDGGYSPIPIASKCTDYSAGLAITVGQRTDDIALDNGSYFLISNQGSAFRALSLPGSGGGSLDWSISATIDLRMKADGTYNTAPKATMISPIYIPVGVPQKISIPTIDADNDNVRCRFANGTGECGSVCPPSSLPSGTTISSNCTLSITGANAGDWYAVAIQVEDFANSTTTTPYSSTPVQFLVHVYNPPTCTQQPYLYGPTLAGTCTAAQVGVPYKLILYVTNYCYTYGTTMVDIATQSFPVVIKTPIVQDNTTTWSVNLTWTPTATEVGPQVFCSVAVDSTSVQSNQYCLTFDVGDGSLGQCPGVEITTTEATTTEAPTTQPPTTTTITQNTTNENITTIDVTILIGPIIMIPICCCFCCWFYFLGPCRSAYVQERKRSVTTYTIEGAYENKDHSLLGRSYHPNEDDLNHSVPQTETSFMTFFDNNPDVDASFSQPILPLNNDLNRSLSITNQNIPLNNPEDDRSMMYQNPMPWSTSLHYDNSAAPDSRTMSSNYPSSVPLHVISTKPDVSSAPPVMQGTGYSKSDQRRIFPRYIKLSSRPNSASSLKVESKEKSTDLNALPTVRPWTKHPRWVLRLSEPKRTYTPPLTKNRVTPEEKRSRSLNSSIRSAATIPRYAFYEE